MKVIIAGSRDFGDYDMLKKTLDAYFINQTWIEVVSGGANGADALGERYAKEKGYNLKRFPADWNTYGRKAGPLRNAEMAKYADALVAFWDGKSAGTRSMIELAEKHNLPTRVKLV